MKKMIVAVMVLVSVLAAGSVFADGGFTITYEKTNEEKVLLVNMVREVSEAGNRMIEVEARLADSPEKGYYYKGFLTKELMVLGTQANAGISFSITLTVNMLTGNGSIMAFNKNGAGFVDNIKLRKNK